MTERHIHKRKNRKTYQRSLAEQYRSVRRYTGTRKKRFCVHLISAERKSGNK
jgi:hypothetical protein